MDGQIETIETLVRVQAHQDMNALLLVRIREIAHKVSLYSCDKLAKLACEALLAFLQDSGNVRLSASVLV